MLTEVPVLEANVASTTLFTWLERYYDDDRCVFLTCLSDAVETIAQKQQLAKNDTYYLANVQRDGPTKNETYRLADLDVELVRREFERRIRGDLADADDLQFTDRDKELVAEYLRTSAMSPSPAK